MADLSRRMASKLLQKFKVNDGDVLLVKSNTELSTDDNMRALATGLKILGHAHTIILVVDEFDNIKTVDETTMAKYGWYRIETLKNQIMKAAKKIEPEEA